MKHAINLFFLYAKCNPPTVALRLTYQTLRGGK